MSCFVPAVRCQELVQIKQENVTQKAMIRKEREENVL